MPDKKTAHTYLAEKLSLPPYYGRNLDALYDVLSAETDAPVCLVIRRREELEGSLGRYGKLLLEVMQDAAQENPYLQVIYGEDEK